MTKLILDWPVGYTYVEKGDATFALAQLFEDNPEYRRTLLELSGNGREVMLDNGAWEFGKSMDVYKYIKIINKLNPSSAVIPDVMKDAIETEKLASLFLNNHKLIKTKTRLMFAPQGKNLKEITKCFNNVVKKYAPLIDVIAIPKHFGKIMMRVKIVDYLWKQSDVKFSDVHFLGYNDFDEIRFGAEDRVAGNQNWRLDSIDTKYPIKFAFGMKFKDQMEYYNTEHLINEKKLDIAIEAFKGNLRNCAWL